MSRNPKPGQALTLTITIDPEYIDALRAAQEKMGLSSPGRALKVIAQVQLAQGDLLATITREQCQQTIHEYRTFLLGRMSNALEELRTEMHEGLNRRLLEQEMGDV